MPLADISKFCLKLKGVGLFIKAVLVLKGILLFSSTSALCSYGAPIQILTFLFSLESFSLYFNMQSALLDMQYCFMQYIFEKVQGAQVTYSGDRLEPGESAVIFSNHQSSADLFMIGALGRKLGMSGCSRYFMKDSIKYIPVFGWVLWMTGQFFLKRNWSEDKALIGRTFDKIIKFKLPVWIISYPEGTRFSPQKKKEVYNIELLYFNKQSQEFAASRGLPPYENVLYPRTKGLVATIQALRDSHVQYIYDVTIAYRQGTSPEGFGKTVGAFQHYYVHQLSPEYRYHIHVDKFLISELPADDKELSGWLLQRFQAKDRFLENLKAQKWTGVLTEECNLRASPL